MKSRPHQRIGLCMARVATDRGTTARIIAGTKYINTRIHLFCPSKGDHFMAQLYMDFI